MHPAPPGASTCPTCGGVLEKTPSGELGCVACLLRAGIGNEQETVHESTPDALEGGPRFGVYEIVRHPDGSPYELGRGAMDSALKIAERAIVLLPRAKDAMDGPGCEENLALIQTIFGENNRAISTLSQLLQTPYTYFFRSVPVTPALLRLDPLWDPLRSDPRFQKLCQEK